MPGPILGAVPEAAMNAAFPLAVYATVCKKLGEPMDFPGDINSWQYDQSPSSSMMNAYMEEWAVLLGPENEKYNTCDNSAFTWEASWPRIAGCKCRFRIPLVWWWSYETSTCKKPANVETIRT